MPEPIRATKKTVEEIFDGAAAQYNRIGPRLFDRAGARLVELLEIGKGARVLDVGTGIGAVLIPAAQRGAHVIGIDLAAEMLKKAEENAKASQLRDYQLVKMDGEHLEFGDAFFDFVVSSFALFLLPSMEAGLREMYRVLKPSGRLGLTVWGPAPFDPAWKMLAELVRAYGVEVRMPNKVSYDPDEIQSLVLSAQFDEVETRIEPIEAVYPNEDAWWQFQFTTGTRAALERMDEETRARFREEYHAKLRSLYRADGLHLPAPVMYVTAIKTRAGVIDKQ